MSRAQIAWFSPWAPRPGPVYIQQMSAPGENEGLGREVRKHGILQERRHDPCFKAMHKWTMALQETNSELGNKNKYSVYAEREMTGEPLCRDIGSNGSSGLVHSS